MTTKQTKILAIIIAIILVGGGYWLLKNRGQTPFFNQSPGDIALPASLMTTAPSLPTADTSSDVSSTDISLWQTYANRQAPIFTFKYPSDAKVGTFSDGTGQTILIQGQSDTIAQIYIVPYSDSTTITAADVTASLPALHVINPQPVQVLGGSGLVFASDNALSTTTEEIWFVRQTAGQSAGQSGEQGYLYEVSVPVAHQALVNQIIQTVKF